VRTHDSDPKYLDVAYSTQPDVTYRYFAGAVNENLELAYALTVHKAQGSDFETVFLILPQQAATLSRELLYTGLTRFRKRMVLLIEKDTTVLEEQRNPICSDTLLAEHEHVRAVGAARSRRPLARRSPDPPHQTHHEAAEWRIGAIEVRSHRRQHPGSRMERVSFQSRDAQDKGLQHVSLEDARIRRLVQQLPRVVVTEPVPCVKFASLPAEVVGYWSLWRIAIDNQSLRDVKIVPIFHHDDGRNLVPTARHIWDALMEDRPDVEQVGTKSGPEIEEVFLRLRVEAERLGEDAFHDLYARHQQRLKREQEKGNYAFQVRREALGRLGLPEVRQHRLKRLDEEERAWAAELRKRERILPELQPVILLRVEAGNG
jgi:hypothetical protein